MTQSPLESIGREGLVGVAPDGTVGALVDVVTVSDGVTDLGFGCDLPGYVGWRWSVSISELPSVAPSVLEVALLPGDGSLLAPPWVPWADRLAEYRRTHPDEVSADDVLADADIDDDDDDLDDELDDDVLDIDSVDVDGADVDDADIDALDIDALDIDEDDLAEDGAEDGSAAAEFDDDDLDDAHLDDGAGIDTADGAAATR